MAFNFERIFDFESSDFPSKGFVEGSEGSELDKEGVPFGGAYGNDLDESDKKLLAGIQDYTLELSDSASYSNCHEVEFKMEPQADLDFGNPKPAHSDCLMIGHEDYSMEISIDSDSNSQLLNCQENKSQTSQATGSDSKSQSNNEKAATIKEAIIQSMDSHGISKPLPKTAAHFPSKMAEERFKKRALRQINEENYLESQAEKLRTITKLKFNLQGPRLKMLRKQPMKQRLTVSNLSFISQLLKHKKSMAVRYGKSSNSGVKYSNSTDSGTKVLNSSLGGNCLSKVLSLRKANSSLQANFSTLINEHALHHR